MKDSTRKSHSPEAQRSRTPEVHLQILSTSDLHMELRGYDYFNDRPNKHGGLARAADLIEKLRNEATNSLLFDNGDMLQGNPMGDYGAARLQEDAAFPHPMIAALNTLNVDAATLGNHEFNFGLSVLHTALSQANFPVVCANVVTKLGMTPDHDTAFVPPFTILPRTVTDTKGAIHNIKIGVLGLLPPQILHWDRRHLEGKVQTRDIVEAAEYYMPLLREAGADVVVVLCHSGIANVKEVQGLENAVVPVAALDGVDAVVAGHSHLVFPSDMFSDLICADLTQGLIHRTPTIMPGFGGSHVGRIDLTLILGQSGWQRRQGKSRAELVPGGAIGTTKAGAAVLKASDAAHEGTLRYIRRQVGETDCPLDSYFAMIEPSRAVRLVATAQARHLRDSVKDTPLGDLPLLSAAAPFRMGGRAGPDHYTDIPIGAVTLRNIADLYGYPNQLCALKINGAALRDWLEFASGIFEQIEPGRADQPLINSSFPSYNFDTIVGVSYALDLTRPWRFGSSGHCSSEIGGRVRDLRYNGMAVKDDMPFIVATNDYRASASGAYPGADSGTVVAETGKDLRQILNNYLQATPADRQLAAAPWRLHPVTKTSVLFETGPGALKYPDRLRDLSIETLEQTKRGFLSCRKQLT